MSRWWMAPVWVLGVFGTAKSFKHNPVLGSRWLNRLGLHVGRMVLAHGVARLRRAMLTPLAPAEMRRRFRRDGYLVIENALPADQFDAVRREAAAASGEVRECIQGDTLTHRILLDEAVLGAAPASRAALRERRIQGLLRYCAAKNVSPLFYFQKIRNGHASGPADPQKTLHSDTFHPTIKAWLFLEDVDEHAGPFCYVPGSHRLSAKRIAWEYRRSLEGPRLADSYSARGSQRAGADDLAALGLPGPIAITAKANTLVIADTRGFHCRGPTTGRRTRREIWAISRTNPFNPLPGLGLGLVDRLYVHGAKALFRWRDAQAARKGSRSSWHVVPLQAYRD